MPKATTEGSPAGYVCNTATEPADAFDGYTNGNLDKKWAELDIVPHRLEIKNKTSELKVYNTIVGGDELDGGVRGYFKSFEVVVNETLSSPGCDVDDFGERFENVTGGADQSVLRLIEFVIPGDGTCYLDFSLQLAIGASQYPGSSLQSYQCTVADCSGGAQTLPLPIRELETASLDKMMTGDLNTDYSWTVFKTADDEVNFENTCRADTPISEPVQVEVFFKREINESDPDGLKLTTVIKATNPANVPLKFKVKDTMFGDDPNDELPFQELASFEGEFVDVPPNGVETVVGEFHLDNQPADLEDVFNIAELIGVQLEDGTPIDIPSYVMIQKESQLMNVNETETNATATISDEEWLVDDDDVFKFNVQSVDLSGSGGATGDFVPAYTEGTNTDGPLVWVSDPITPPANGTTYSIVFNKQVVLEEGANSTGELNDIVRYDLGGGEGPIPPGDKEALCVEDDQETLPMFCGDIPIEATALVDITINKTIPEIWDLSQGYLIFGFQIQDDGGTPIALDPADDVNPEIAASADIPADVKAAPANNDLVEILFEDGDGTSKSVTLEEFGLPGTYIIKEIDDASTDPDGTGLNDGGLVPDPEVPNPDTRTVMPNIEDCGDSSGVADFDNVLPPTGITVIATKSTITEAADLPDGNLADGWTIWLRNDSDDSIYEVGLTGDGDNETGEYVYFLENGTPIEVIPTGDYYFEERLDDQDPDFYLKSAIGTNTGANDGDKLCPFTIAYPQSLNTAYRCDITNELKGTITIIKDTDPDGGQMFDFCQDIGDRGGDEQCETDVFKFSLDDDGQEQFLDLFPGDYNVSEPLNFDGTVASNADFHFTSIVCEETDDSDGNGESAQVGDTSAALIQLDPGEDVTCTWTNTEKGKVNLIKTYNGGTEFPDGVIFRFRLTGPGVNLNGNNPDDEAQAPPSLVEFLMGQDDPPLLKAGAQYKLCELDVQAGFSVEWSLEGQLLPQTDNQNAINEVYIEGGGGSTYCVNFLAEAGTLITYEVDNIDPPGGDPRTIGYWRNWSTCSGGKQAEKAAEDDTKWLLDDFVNSDYEPAITLGEGKTLGEQTTAGQPDEDKNCLEARRVLMKRTTHAGNGQCGIAVNKNLAKDGAYRLAAQLLGTKLNIEAGACTISGLQTKIDEAESLLTDVGYDGKCRDIMSGKFSKNKDRLQEANQLNNYFDDYNNGEFCGGGEDD